MELSWANVGSTSSTIMAFANIVNIRLDFEKKKKKKFKEIYFLLLIDSPPLPKKIIVSYLPIHFPPSILHYVVYLT